MKCVYFLVLVSIWQIDCTTLRAPNLLSMTTVDPPGFKITWSSVTSDDSSDPVLGYKVKVWEYPTVRKELKEVEVNGVKKWEEVDVIDSPWYHDQKPIGEKEIVTDKTDLLVTDLKFNIKYEAKVRAYTKTTEGPMSNPMSVIINQ